MNGPYDDILHLPHPVSPLRTPMPRENRAAQFSPFAALTGYEAALSETARLTNERIDLGEDAKAVLDLKLQALDAASADQPTIAVTYFRPDEKKAGGVYVTAIGVLKRIDDCARVLIMLDGGRIAIESILHIECGLFKDMV